MRPAVHVTWRGSGKMEGFTSINDDPYSNEYCTSQCSNREHCYAKWFCLFRPSLGARFRQNGDLMSTGRFVGEQSPLFLPGSVVRLHSFGEYRNIIHLLSHIMIARRNPDVKFVGWTHRKDLVQMVNLPPNMRMIFSESVNAVYGDIPPGFSGVYIPVTPEVAEQERIRIFCSGQKCKDCMRCYGDSNPGVVYAKYRPVTTPAEMPI